MPVRDYSRSIVVNNTTKMETLKTLRGERVYLLIENNTANPIVCAPDTAPALNAAGSAALDGITIPANFRYERYAPFCPQNDYVVRGTTAADQSVQITEGYRED